MCVCVCVWKEVSLGFIVQITVELYASVMEREHSISLKYYVFRCKCFYATVRKRLYECVFWKAQVSFLGRVPPP